MEKVADYYHQSLLKNETAIDYINSRGITSAEAITKFRLGFCDGSFSKTLNKEDRAYLFNIGLLYENGKERLRNYVVFPLWDKEQPHINNLYGRHISRPRHFYLQNTIRSLFNPLAVHESKEIIITESIIDALALWSVGVNKCDADLRGYRMDKGNSESSKGRQNQARYIISRFRCRRKKSRSVNRLETRIE